MRSSVTTFCGLVIATAILLQASALISGQSEQVAPVMFVELGCQASKPDTSVLSVTLRNPAPDDTAVVLGITLANGRAYLPTGLKLRVRRSGDTREDDLPYANPTFGGRLDSWIVPLPAGASFTLSVPVRHFIRSGAYTTEFKRFVPGGDALDLRVAFDARPIEFGPADMRLMRVWVGALTSNPIHLPNHCIEPFHK